MYQELILASVGEEGKCVPRINLGLCGGGREATIVVIVTSLCHSAVYMMLSQTAVIFRYPPANCSRCVVIIVTN